MPKVSVIMNCYNGEKYLREAIDSIYAQTFKDWEIIFWDNCSTDSSPDIAKSYDSRLRYFRAETFTSLGIARNKAVGQAEGEYIAFLDCDDLWLPGKLELQMPLFEKDRDTILIYSNYLIRDLLINREYAAFNPPKDFHSGMITRYLCKKNFIGFQTVIIRKDALQRLDTVFDNGLMYATDFDLYLRLSLQGKFDFTPETLVAYRKHKSNFTYSKRHIIAHDFSYLLEKYKRTLDKRSLKGIATLYKDCFARDLRNAGFRIMPAFLIIGFSFRKILTSFIFLLFTEKQFYVLIDKLESFGVLKHLLNIFHGISPLEKGTK
jgi:glycosyltransferase involved in cell wall biosynthesis